MIFVIYIHEFKVVFFCEQDEVLKDSTYDCRMSSIDEKERRKLKRSARNMRESLKTT